MPAIGQFRTAALTSQFVRKQPLTKRRRLGEVSGSLVANGILPSRRAIAALCLPRMPLSTVAPPHLGGAREGK